MTSTLIPTCAFCGLRFASGALLELHIREDHARPPRPPTPAPAGHDDRAGPRASQPEHGEAAPAGTGRENTGGGAMAMLRRITAAFRHG